ncbi:hypothetical protein [Nonomuraea angiospora]
MAAAAFDMLVEQGIDYDYVITVRSQASGQPSLDLIGCTVRAPTARTRCSCTTWPAAAGPLLGGVDARRRLAGQDQAHELAGGSAGMSR